MKSLTPEIMVTSLGQVGGVIAVIIVAVIALELLLYFLLKRLAHYRYAIPIMLIAPGVIGLLILNVYPIIYEIVMAFSNMNLLRFRNPTYSFAIGWQNLKSVFTEPVLKQQYFFPVFLRTALWTVIQVFFHVSFGLFLAILLNRPMKMRGLYRTLLVIPWSLPQVVASLAWRGEFNFEYGFPNVMLTRLGLQAIQWKSNPFWNFVAMNITNIWLGIPFMIVILLGGLQSLSKSYYEAADMDGARPWKQFTSITMPLIKPILTPAIVLGVIWTFNNFNVPYFINENNLETSDILVTALFKAAFDFNRYGFSAMFALIIFAILLGITIIYMRVVSFSPSALASRKAKETLTVGEEA
jgi:arabinogalactan oligomer / maltooligosaccharide transport system permease protein